MGNSFRSQVHALKKYATLFDPPGHDAKLQSLGNISVIPLVNGKDLITYFETLLFIIAHPADQVQLSRAERELLRITNFLFKLRKAPNKTLTKSGMPFTPTITRFSHDGVRWLLVHPDVTTALHSFEDPALDLNEVLRLTLPSIEKGETTAGLNNMDLMDVLLVPKQHRLPFLVDELAKLDHLPYIKDHLFDRLEVFVRIMPVNKSFSLAYNRLHYPTPYFNQELLKKFDTNVILASPLPAFASLIEQEKDIVKQVIKNSMVLTIRETDPATFMDENSLLLFHLERGISVAIYGMIPSRQLPLESYVGYTAFKNGFPVAYGGAWVFGERANFGINIFKYFRNGESAYIMSQLLRVYKQVFKLSYFEIEPYQFGLDNPEGIESGAFWFYYRFGFRPLDPALHQLAKKEYEKIKSKKEYRTSHKTLIRFTQSSIGLKLKKEYPLNVSTISGAVTRMIQRTYKGIRVTAETDCRNKFLTNVNLKSPLNAYEHQVLTEVALWARAMHITDPGRLDLLARMITAKPQDVYAYQDLVSRFFSL